MNMIVYFSECMILHICSEIVKLSYIHILVEMEYLEMSVCQHHRTNVKGMNSKTKYKATVKLQKI